MGKTTQTVKAAESAKSEQSTTVVEEARRPECMSVLEAVKAVEAAHTAREELVEEFKSTGNAEILPRIEAEVLKMQHCAAEGVLAMLLERPAGQGQADDNKGIPVLDIQFKGLLDGFAGNCFFWRDYNLDRMASYRLELERLVDRERRLAAAGKTLETHDVEKAYKVRRWYDAAETRYDWYAESYGLLRGLYVALTGREPSKESQAKRAAGKSADLAAAKSREEAATKSADSVASLLSDISS